MVVRLSALRTGRIYPQEINTPGNHFCQRLSRPPGTWCDQKDLYQWKIPMTPSGIEPATFFYEIMWTNFVVRGRPQITIWRLRITCWIPKATNTHSVYVTLIAFQLQQLLQEKTAVLRYTYISCLKVDSDAGEIPRRKSTLSTTRRKFEKFYFLPCLSPVTWPYVTLARKCVTAISIALKHCYELQVKNAVTLAEYNGIATWSALFSM
jgi:hypothetical protein